MSLQSMPTGGVMGSPLFRGIPNPFSTRYLGGAGSSIAPTVRKAKVYDARTGQLIQNDEPFTPEEIAKGAGRIPGGIRIQPGTGSGSPEARIGNRYGTMAPPSPNALDANGRLSGLAAYYQMQRPGAGPLDEFNRKADFERKAATYPAPTAWPSLRPYSPWGTNAPLPMNENQGIGVDYNVGKQSPLGGADVEFAAKGARAKAIQPYVVNEKGMESYHPRGGRPMLIPGGPQFFIPPKDGKIIPHDETMEMIEDLAPEVLPPKHRYGGGGVRGYGGYPLPPWAMGGGYGGLPWMQQQIPPWMMGGYAGYEGAMAPAQEFQVLQSPTLQQFWANNPNAPDISGLNSPLARYVRMGIQNQSAWSDARAAAQAVLQHQAAQDAANKAAVAFDVPTSAIYSAPNGMTEMQGVYGRGFAAPSGVALPPWAARLPRLAPVTAPAGSWQETQALQQLMAERSKLKPIKNNPYRERDTNALAALLAP